MVSRETTGFFRENKVGLADARDRKPLVLVAEAAFPAWKPRRDRYELGSTPRSAFELMCRQLGRVVCRGGVSKCRHGPTFNKKVLHVLHVLHVRNSMSDSARN